MSTLAVSVRGTKEARKLLDSLSDRELNNRTRRATRAGAKVMRTELRSEVKSGTHPKTFRKTATKNHRNPIGTSVGPTSPLINVFEGGAKRHTIAPGKLSVEGRRFLLSGKAGEHYRDRDFVASMPVSHPGMSARPLIGPVFDKTKDDASEKAMDALLEGLK